MKELPDRIPVELLEIIDDLNLRGRVWLVGGAVRDLLLQRVSTDFDLVVEGDALAAARRAANRLGGDFYILDAGRATARVLHSSPRGIDLTFDFAQLRANDIEADLRGRDFTVNALAIDPARPSRLIDPTGGFADLRASLLRVCQAEAIQADPVRAVRAVRLAGELSLRIEEETIACIREGQKGLNRISPERIRDELFRILSIERPDQSLRVLHHFGMSAHLFPEFWGAETRSPPLPDERWTIGVRRVQRTRELAGALKPGFDAGVVENSTLGLASVHLGRFRTQLNAYLNQPLGFGRPARAHTTFCALYYQIGEGDPDRREALASAEAAAGWAHRMRLSRVEGNWIKQCVFAQMAFPQGVPDSQRDARGIYRFYRDAHEAGVASILVALADELAQASFPPLLPVWESRLARAQAMLSAWFDEREKLVDPPRIIRGDDLAEALGIPFGPGIGDLLESVREAQVAGEVRTREEAIELLRHVVQGDES
jgi:poly(A) polymerase